MRRLILSLIIITLLALVALGGLMDHLYQEHIYQEPGAELVTTEHQQLIQLARQYAKVLAEQPEMILKLESDSVAVSQSRLSDFPLPPELMASFKSGEPLMLQSQNTLTLHFYQPEQQQVIGFEFNTPLNREPPLSQRVLLTLLFYLGIIFIILLWTFPLARRLLSLGRAIKRFGSGDLDVRIRNSPWSFIQNIEQGFNRMAQRINLLIEDNRLLSRAVSHDLRTPIARLRFGIALLQEDELTEQQAEHCEHLNQDLDEMESLVETLLSYARLEQGKIKLNLEVMSLDEFITRIIQECRSGCPIECELQPTQVGFDPHYFGMLIRNLLGNACRYANNKVLVRLTQEQGQISFVVEDDGPGLASSEYENVLKPFYRADRTSKGHGMGLAIVSRIAQWHHCQVTLNRSEVLGGLSVQVRFI